MGLKEKHEKSAVKNEHVMIIFVNVRSFAPKAHSILFTDQDFQLRNNLATIISPRLSPNYCGAGVVSQNEPETMMTLSQARPHAHAPSGNFHFS
jgi:hypothetical protein